MIMKTIKISIIFIASFLLLSPLINANIAENGITLKIRGGVGYHLIVNNPGNESVIANFHVKFVNIFTQKEINDEGIFNALPHLITNFQSNSPYFFSRITAELSAGGKTINRTGFVIMKIVIFF